MSSEQNGKNHPNATPVDVGAKVMGRLSCDEYTGTVIASDSFKYNTSYRHYDDITIRLDEPRVFPNGNRLEDVKLTVKYGYTLWDTHVFYDGYGNTVLLNNCVEDVSAAFDAAAEALQNV